MRTGLRQTYLAVLCEAAGTLESRSDVIFAALAMHLRCATFDDAPQLQSLIADSIRTLGANDYRPAQIEGALKSAFGVDTQLIKDGTYFVVETDGRLVACGGWSKRRTLFGSDSRIERDPVELDPAQDAAKIRAFFVHPDYARRGIGKMLLERCEQAALAAGFKHFEMMATLPGVRLYSACGYIAGERVYHPLGDGLHIEFVPMTKSA